MKTFWKVLGFAALAAGLTPYKVDKDEETGEKSYQALLWSGTSKRDECSNSLDIRINLEEGTLTSKILDAVDKKKEAHLFTDELSVDYHGSDEDEEDFVEEETAAAETETVSSETETAVKEAEAADETETSVDKTEVTVDEAETAVAEAETAADEAEAAVAEVETVDNEAEDIIAE